MSWEHLSPADQAYLNRVASPVRRADAERSTGECVCIALVVVLMAMVALLGVVGGLQRVAWTKVALDHPVASRGHAEPVTRYAP